MADQAPGFYRYKVGSLVVTTLLDGSAARANPTRGFVLNADSAAVEKAILEAGLNPASLDNPYNVTVVQTGRQTILFDAGTGGQLNATSGKIPANMAAAGIDPAKIDIVAITHFHGDHISGLTSRENAVLFSKAEIVVPAVEWAWWTDEANVSRTPEGQRGTFANTRRRFAPYAGRLRMVADGGQVAPGIRLVAAHGHTPGHSVFQVSDGAETLYIMGDCSSRPELFLRFADWYSINDVDGPMASASRKRLFGRAADERARVVGFHFPFPANGYVAREGSGFRFVPAEWSSAT